MIKLYYNMLLNIEVMYLITLYIITLLNVKYFYLIVSFIVTLNVTNNVRSL